MAFVCSGFASKLSNLRASLYCTWEQVAERTGILSEGLTALAAATATPTGDEVLILSDHFGCEFTWLIEDEAANPAES